MATSTRRTTTTTTVRTVNLFGASENNEPEDALLTDLFTAYYIARANKRNTYSQMRFERNLSENLVSLYEDIRNRKYKVGRSECFIVREKVKREIFAASFRDRIVHHLLFNYLNPILEPTFIEDSYSCRKGKGTMYAGKRLQWHMRSVVSKFGSAYILKLDIKSYFLSINKDILFDMVEGKMDKSDKLYDVMSYLLKLIIYNDPTYRCRIKGELSDWSELPKSKSLFHAAPNCGLPIGNLTSQLFSNVYLSALDDYITGKLGFRHYGRYVDDFYIIHADKKTLLDSIPQIRSFLSSALKLQLHPNKLYLQECFKGVSFVGYYVTPLSVRIDFRTFKKMKYHLYLAMCMEQNPYYLKAIGNSIGTTAVQSPGIYK